MNLSWKIGLLGAGRLGTALTGELYRRGLSVVAIADRDSEKAKILTDHFCTSLVTTKELAQRADLVIIAVPDDAIAEVAQELSETGDWQDKIALHTSGSRSSEVLSPLKAVGAAVGSIHPLQSFSGGESIPAGTVYGIEGDAIAVDAAQKLARFLDGRPLMLTSENKPLYHAAACMAANYLVTLLDLAQKMLISAGLQEGEAIPALFPLVDGVLGNVRRNGTVKGLTGPIVRGDAETVAAHLTAITEQTPEILPIYLAMAQATLNLAVEAGLPADNQQAIREVISHTPPL